MLSIIHKAEDDKQSDTFFVKSIKSALNKFLAQTINRNGIEVVFSEFEMKEQPINEQNKEITPIYTDKPDKDGTLYRTICPGVIINGKLYICEKVEIWRYKE